MEQHPSLGDELPGAVERGEIWAQFQPQLEFASSQVVAVEALARWEHPRFGAQAPDDFIPIAENGGAIHELGSFMLRTSIQAAVAWRDRGIDLEMAVNVSVVQLSDDGFTRRLMAMLDEASMDPHRLVLEITESQAIHDLVAVAHVLDGIRDAGVQLSLDDFGSGYASLAHVQSLPLDEIKLDRSVVNDESMAASSLLTGMVDFFHRRGLRIVAEGVETQAQLNRMRELGCDRAQGYYVARPMAARELEELLSA